MRKVFRFFLLFVCVVMMSGCNKNVAISNFSSVDLKEVKSIDDVMYNVRESINHVKGINFETKIKYKEKEYLLSGKIIIGETIEKSVISINYGKNSFYMKKGNVYISYFYNNTNVVIKDSINNFVSEIVTLLNNKGVKCDANKIMDIIKNKTIADISYDKLAKYITFDGSYSFTYKNFNLTLNDKFLPSLVAFNNGKVSVETKANYNEVKINIPLGYDLFVMNINSIKELLRIDNISDLIR